ncbi:MAG: VCBS repeat-containing protein [Pirellulales bacterium]
MESSRADLDHDGDSDVAISHWGPVRIFENPLRRYLCVPPYPSPTSSRTNDGLWSWYRLPDIDNDGNLDLFASNYVDFTIERYQQVALKSFPYPPGPKDFPPSIDRLYRNRGDGTFSDVTAASGIDRYPGPTMGVICGDFDDDGDADIFACSDAAPNQFFVNDGKGQFTDMALGAGLAFDVAGNVNGSMGVDAADFDRDGHVDFPDHQLHRTDSGAL